MGNISETLAGVAGIEWYYIAGIIIFVSLFIGVLIYTYAIPKKDLHKFKTSIFEKDELTGNKNY